MVWGQERAAMAFQGFSKGLVDMNTDMKQVGLKEE